MLFPPVCFENFMQVCMFLFRFVNFKKLNHAIEHKNHAGFYGIRRKP